MENHCVHRRKPQYATIFLPDFDMFVSPFFHYLYIIYIFFTGLRQGPTHPDAVPHAVFRRTLTQPQNRCKIRYYCPFDGMGKGGSNA